MQRTVKGGSMLPYLRSLDVCITREVDPSGLASGDIIVYESAEVKELYVHRVLGVSGDRTHVFVKGDNIPARCSEKVSVSRVKEKVIKVERASKTLNLDTTLARAKGKMIAFLSKHDLTPLLLKARCIDPVLLRATKTSFFVRVRKLFYKNISFMSTRDKTRCNVYAFVSGRKSAHAVLDLKGDCEILISSYIKHRDRNPVFAEKFFKKVVEVADAEYGSERDIYVKDPELKSLIFDSEAFFFSDRIFFK